jgi:uncharacterized protein YlxW (UPF0749 family)
LTIPVLEFLFSRPGAIRTSIGIDNYFRPLISLSSQVEELTHALTEAEARLSASGFDRRSPRDASVDVQELREEVSRLEEEVSQLQDERDEYVP